MLRVTVLERGRIVRGDTDDDLVLERGGPNYRVLPQRLYDRLERSEVAHEDRKSGRRIIDWRRRYGIMGQWVGVLQIPGLQLEILPKTDSAEPHPDETGSYVDDTRRNLMSMLVRGGMGVVRSRGIADLALKRGSIHDRLVDAFLERAIFELERGLDRHYSSEEANLLVLRGRLLIGQHVTRNAAQRHRFYCRHDVLTESTPISIRLKQACQVLAKRPLPERVHTKAMDVLAMLADVPAVAFRLGEPDPIFNRQNDRFEDIYQFASMVLEGQAADVRAGAVETFTLLFDMDQVFERFVAAFVQAEVIPDIAGAVARPQGKGDRRPLFHDSKGQRDVLHLKPDLLVELDGRVLVIDTKWKRLSEQKAARPSNADLYQLYAYLHRYDCEHAILLYPAVAGLEQRDLDVVPGNRKVGVRFIDMGCPLWTREGKAALANDLQTIVREGLARADDVEASA
jgi:5-methylcytosine-specific restriction enzyme subunit McrC